MLLYKDIVSGDEMISDAFPMKDIDDLIYEVDCQMIIVKDGNVDIGANPSAEEQEEALESGAQSVNDIVHSFRLQEIAFDAKTYIAHLQGYMKVIQDNFVAKNAKKAANADKAAAAVDNFKAKTNALARKIVKDIKAARYGFYTGESLHENGMVALLDYREDGITPYFTLWKYGLEEVKL